MIRVWLQTFRKRSVQRTARLFGVVVNAVDDHLLKGEQIDTRWTRDENQGPACIASRTGKWLVER